MAVVAMWQCDRDGSMFASKKDAEAYDRMLELAESFTAFIEANTNGISTEDAEALGQLMSQHKDQIVAACKGKPESLLSIAATEAEDGAAPDSDDAPAKRRKKAVVTPLVSAG
jgi:dsDNA-binding SOS-regulon protein